MNFLILYFPVFNFGPILNKGSLISSLTRKAFAIETSNNLESAFLLLEEIFKDEEYFWQDLYKYED